MRYRRTCSSRSLPIAYSCLSHSWAKWETWYVMAGAHIHSVAILIYQQIQATMPVAEPLPPVPSADSTLEQTIPPPSASIQLTPLLGVAQSEHLETLHSIYASSIATLVWTYEAEGSLGGDRRAIVVGVALKKSGDVASDTVGLTEHERTVFFGVMEVLRELLSKK